MTMFSLNNKMIYAKDNWIGLQSYWRLNEVSGSTAVDSGVNNYAGTLTNSVFDASGKRGYCVLFDSATDKIELASNTYYDFERTDKFSFSFWYKPTSIPTTRFLLSKQTPSGIYNGYAILSDGTGAILTALGGDGTHYIYQTSNLKADSTSTFYLIVCTYNGSSVAAGLNVYLNGVLCTQTVASNNLGTVSIKNTAKFSIGYRGDNISANGRIDEVGVWNRELTQFEITALYAAGTGKFY